MTAPLFDVKARFSEYVAMAENGEIVAVTKHGKTSVLLISQEQKNFPTTIKNGSKIVGKKWMIPLQKFLKIPENQLLLKWKILLAVKNEQNIPA